MTSCIENTSSSVPTILTLACPVSERFPLTIKLEFVTELDKLGLMVDETGGEDWTGDGLVPESAGGGCDDGDTVDAGDNSDLSSLDLSLLMFGFKFLDGDFGDVMLTGSGKRDSGLLLLDAVCSLTPLDRTFL